MGTDRTPRTPAGRLPAFVFRPHSTRLCACVLVLLTLVSYVPALDAGFVFDDSMYLTEDARMDSAAGLGDIWTEVGGPDYRHQYYPLTSSAFWVQHQVFGDRPVGYHLVNVLLHALNALLLWRLLRRLGLPAAWLAAAVFAVHPVHVQSVAWISELKNVLSTAFFLSSGLLLVRYLGVGEATQRRSDTATKGEDPSVLPPPPIHEQPGREAAPPALRRSVAPSLDPSGWWVYAAGLALFVCALLSKTATSLLPVALLLVVWWKRGRVDRRSLLAVTPLAVVGVAFVLLTVYLESSHGGAQGAVFSQTWLERALIAGRALWFYAGKLLWPAELVFIYPRWTIDASSWWQYLYPLAALSVIGLLWGIQDRVGRGPAAAVLFFAAAVVPISLVNVAFTRLSYVSDHWQYWASMGLIALAVGALTAGWIRWRPSWAPAGTGVLASVLVLVVLSGLTWRRSAVYESPITLWSDTLVRNPDAWAAHNNLGIALAEQGRFDEAVSHYLKALVLRPEDADAHNNLGNAVEAQGRLEEAIIHYRWALRIDADCARAHYNLANALRQAGDLETALRHYRQALRIDQRYVKAHNNFGTALLERGRLDEAAAHFQCAIRVDPNHAGARYNLGIARYRQGRVPEAARQFEAALAIDPEFTGARANLAAIVQAHAPGTEIR